MDHPMVVTARSLLRRAGGDPLVEQFDEALEDYGPERAISEAVAGAAVGVGVEELRRRARQGQTTPQASAENPNVHHQALDGEEGLLLTVDVAHDELEVIPHDTMLVLRTPHGYFEHVIGFEPREIEWLSESGATVSEVVVRPHFGVDVIDVDEFDTGDEGEEGDHGA